MKIQYKKLGFAQPSSCWYVLLKNMKTKGSALLKKTSKCYQTPPRDRSGQGNPLLKYEAQIPSLPPPTAETLNRYDPPETLIVTNNSAWMNEASKSPETL
jgi:hypothetical protein